MPSAPRSDPPSSLETRAPGVSVRGLGLAHGRETLFEGLDLALPAGTWTCLLGPSGVGKTSLLRVVAGLAAADAGAVAASDGRPLAGRVAWMGQRDDLLPWLSAVDNVTLGARLRGGRPDRAAARARLARLGVGDRADARPAALSGGQRQRVALARTLHEDRPVVLMDEPFSSLDVLTRARLQDLAGASLAGRTVLLITHDPLEALRLGHRVYAMTGRPARLSPPIEPPGAPPRPVDDPALLALQGRLIRELSGRAAGGRAAA